MTGKGYVWETIQWLMKYLRYILHYIYPEWTIHNLFVTDPSTPRGDKNIKQALVYCSDTNLHIRMCLTWLKKKIHNDNCDIYNNRPFYFITTNPVSYTHLDVNKRQVWLLVFVKYLKNCVKFSIIWYNT